MQGLAEIDAGLEEMLAQAMGQAPRENLSVRFYVEPMQNEQKTVAAGRPIFEDTAMVEIRVPGQTDVIRHPVTDEDIKRFPALYKAFLERRDQTAVEGTPLREWPSVTRAQAEELIAVGIRTVEHLAGAPDTSIQRLGPLMGLRQKARDWLAAAKDNSVLSKLRSENDDLRARLTACEQMLNMQSQEIAASRGGAPVAAPAGPDPRLAALEAQIAALAAAVQQKPEPKRRGRPPKAATAEPSSI
jgi:hypothetical protein